MRNFRWFEEQNPERFIIKETFTMQPNVHPHNRMSDQEIEFFHESFVRSQPQFNQPHYNQVVKERKKQLALRHLKLQHQAQKQGDKKITTDDLIDFHEGLKCGDF